MILEAMVHLAQTVHLSCTETNTVSKWTETSFHLSLVDVHTPMQRVLQVVWPDLLVGSANLITCHCVTW
jgi:hypothetical protein